jgi:hypothetical protein
VFVEIIFYLRQFDCFTRVVRYIWNKWLISVLFLLPS